MIAVPIIISIIALIISFVSLYFQFFHRKSAINGRLIEFGSKDSEDDCTHFFTFSIGNTGNQEIILKKIEIWDKYEDQQSPSVFSTLGRTHKCKDVPCVLLPGQIKLFEVWIAKQVDFITKNQHAIDTYFHFQFISITGKSYSLSHSIQHLIPTDPEEYKLWLPFTLKNAKSPFPDKT